MDPLFFVFISFYLPLTQLQNGTGSGFGHLPTSSSTSALRAGGTVSTDHAGDIHITRVAPGVEPLPPSSDKSLPHRHPDGPAWRSQDSADHQRYRVFSQGDGGADLGGGKRKLPSPEGTVRQVVLPQPVTGRERRRGEEEWEGEEQRLARGGGDRAMQSCESHMEWQEAYLREEGHYSDSRKNTAISGGKEPSASFISQNYFFVVYSHFHFLLLLTY